MKEDLYTVKAQPAARIYGIEIDNIFLKKFSEIEKELNAKIKVNKEVSAIFIRRESNFALKIRDQILNPAKDHFDVLYGPVEDASLFDIPGSVRPRSLVFYGTLSVGEPIGSKQTILKELGNMLSSDTTSKEILDKINRDFIIGMYREGRALKINFDMPGYPIAYFSIVFSGNGQIVYQYVFSKTKEVYPRI